VLMKTHNPPLAEWAKANAAAMRAFRNRFRGGE
jgi:hypothetical protein